MLSEDDRLLLGVADTLANGPEGPPDAGALLDELTAFLRRYVVFASDAQADAVALWIVHTYLLDDFDATPYLSITSPEKRSGKTRLLDVLELVAARTWRAVSPSEAVVYRKIEADCPTLLLDEVDTIFAARAANYEGLRALLNAGYQRGTKVPRCVGEGSKVKVQEFAVFCPKALAGIGTLPATVADRSIPIRLARKMPSESVERFRFKRARAEAAPLREALEALAVALPTDPDVPDALSDRAQDCWEPLLAIADAAGGEWPVRARSAALALSADRPAEDESLPIQLLAGCRAAFDDADADRLSSEKLVGALLEIPESPWSDLHGRTLTARRLAAMLRRYGIRSTKIRIDAERTAQGYYRTAFEDAWRRYLPSDAPAPRNTVSSGTDGTQQLRTLNGDSPKGTPQVEALWPSEAVTCAVPSGEDADSPLTSHVPDVPDRSAFRGEGADSEACGRPVPGDESGGEAS